MRCRVLILALVVLASGPGCVQRRMTIRSNPPGALVYVDDYQLGSTPVSHDFIYYGTRKIRLVKDGFETLTVRQPFPIPWYQYFPFDFVTENLIPWEIRDERVVDLAMMPAAAMPPESVVTRAEQVRLAAGSLPAADPPRVVPLPAAGQAVTAPPPALPPARAFAPQPLPPPAGGLVLPPQQPPSWQGLQPPVDNAPRQGLPSLGTPPAFGAP
ncbi:MAG: PEGA domain-containing protein [Planctomycetes bacterium]|nr:PEGA domain-containing protein [Planctomycetota bacterium]